MTILDKQTQITVQGRDAEKFLQGQVTCDAANMAEGQMAFGASCNLKGRVVATFRIIRQQAEHFQLLMPTDTVSLFKEHIQKYIVFSKATLTEQEITEANPTWRLQDIEAGFPNIFANTSGLFTPHMLNLPQLGAVSFNKGCYLGQEVIARSQHLGAVKRHLYAAKLKNTQLPLPGDQLVNQHNKAIGTVIDAYPDNQWIKLLSVIQDNAVNETILLNDQPIVFIKKEAKSS